MTKMKMLRRRRANLTTPAVILGLVALGWALRGLVPEAIRYVRLKSM